MFIKEKKVCGKGTAGIQRKVLMKLTKYHNITFRGAKLWNGLKGDCKQTSTLNSF